MSPDTNRLRRELRNAGLTNGVIDAVWPEWWSTAAENSKSADAELRFTIARRLGVSPRSLFEGPPRFVWRDRAKYKNLGTASPEEVAILTSFGVAVAQALLPGAPAPRPLPRSALELRNAMLTAAPVIGLGEILAFCWGTGIPVLQLRLFPLPQKRMHAMTVALDGRFAILIGQETKYTAKAAYTIAHELAHVLLDHASGSAAILDVEDPFELSEADDEELSADRFALEMLTGDPDVRVEADTATFTATQLADAAATAAAKSRVDAGILALCLAHSTGKWKEAIGSLKIIPPVEIDVGSEINNLAGHQLSWSELPLEAQDYLRKVM